MKPKPKPKLRPGDPQSLGAALSQLFAIKGFANTRTDADLTAAWNEIAGEKVAGLTAVLGVHRGVLQIGVASSAMLNELVAFHQQRLLDGLRQRYPALKLRDIKFRLRGDLTRPTETPPQTTNPNQLDTPDMQKSEK